jgi:hypothetical protein
LFKEQEFGRAHAKHAKIITTWIQTSKSPPSIQITFEQQEKERTWFTAKNSMLSLTDHLRKRNGEKANPTKTTCISSQHKHKYPFFCMKEILFVRSLPSYYNNRPVNTCHFEQKIIQNERSLLNDRLKDCIRF